MESKFNYTLVGLFVLLLGGLLVGGVFWLYTGGQYHQQFSKYLTYFDESVAGLNRNAPVRYRGVEVGRVAEIDLAPDQSGRVRVLMNIDDNTPIKEDTVANLKMQGLTGLASIELSGGSAQSKRLQKAADENYPVIPAKHSFMKRLDTAMSDLMTNVNQTSENLNALTDAEMRQSIRQVIQNLDHLTRIMAEQKPAIEAMIKHAGHTFEASGKAATEVTRLAQRMHQTTQVVEKMAQDLAAAGRSVRGTLDDARQPMRDMADQTLPELNAMAAEMRELAATLKRVSTDLERHPEMFVFGRGTPRPGPGE